MNKSTKSYIEMMRREKPSSRSYAELLKHIEKRAQTQDLFTYRIVYKEGGKIVEKFFETIPERNEWIMKNPLEHYEATHGEYWLKRI